MTVTAQSFFKSQCQCSSSVAWCFIGHSETQHWCTSIIVSLSFIFLCPLSSVVVSDEPYICKPLWNGYVITNIDFEINNLIERELTKLKGNLAKLVVPIIYLYLVGVTKNRELKNYKNSGIKNLVQKIKILNLGQARKFMDFYVEIMYLYSLWFSL